MFLGWSNDAVANSGVCIYIYGCPKFKVVALLILGLCISLALTVLVGKNFENWTSLDDSGII